MKRLILTAAFALTINLAYAEPVYLECSIPGFFEKFRNFSVKLDEANGKITHTGSEEAYNVEGFFSANNISYKFARGSLPYDNDTYTIDRSTLSIQWRSSAENVSQEQGQCSKIEVKNNKI